MIQKDKQTSVPLTKQCELYFLTPIINYFIKLGKCCFEEYDDYNSTVIRCTGLDWASSG